MAEAIGSEGAVHCESSRFGIKAVTQRSYPASQASIGPLAELDTVARLQGEAANAKDYDRPRNSEVPRREIGMRRAEQAAAFTHHPNHEEEANMEANITESQGNRDFYNDVTTVPLPEARSINLHAREALVTLQEENESNDEGQGCRSFKEWTHIKGTERQSVNSEQPNPPLEQEIKERLPIPSPGPEVMTPTTTVCATIHAKESGFQGNEKAQCICESAGDSDNAIKRGMQGPLQTLQIASEASLIVTITVPPGLGSRTVPRQKQSDGEGTPTGISLGANGAESCCPSQYNPSINAIGRLGMSGGGSRESVLDPGDVLLLSATGKAWTGHTGVDAKASLAGDVGLASGGGQAEAYATGSEPGKRKDERNRPVLCHNVSESAGVDASTGSMEQECPVCTELYDCDAHKQALLNCNHSFCDSCVKSIMEKAGASSASQIRCPVCRQRTPMPEWEIRQLQEEMTFLNRVVAGRPGVVPTHPAPQGGPCERLEQAFRQRLLTTRSCGYLPCLRYPLWMVNALARCDQTCPCCYLCSILLLYGLELLCLSLIFIPVIILILLFTLLDKE